MKLYDLQASGNCYKVRLFAALANIELEVIAVDFLNAEHKRPPLSDLNPLGELPVLQDGPVVLRDSQAILVYLAGEYGGLAWWPAHPQGQAEIVQWLSFASNEIQHSLCAARLVQKFGAVLNQAEAVQKASVVLGLLDKHLEQHDWLAIGRPTIAECAVYPYVALAPEGGVELQTYPNVLRWAKRVEGLTGYSMRP
ncbi:Glutathione S-transferase family protein [Pseudomonas syringae pv. helianthi]|uniref:Glutathione S-transferase protein n=2 Tax=Pseudomonas syringae group TaxID=136849 RepID=A0A0P9PB01_9PSED|nr:MULTISPECIES: glutathione S-transferase [Pseudomonas syringae group]KAA8692904.1 glutathione S-transferase [Pseudomonas caricapapayae]KPW53952.1 Glutathione S-transferase family protein [Pseudomonas caricapapayae]KPX39804.1 Glutathione S-transferase family protein [Pseudomonas syringae pv. helianthi]RMM14724.1 Glutathione S-transferase protein [Pseudomonas caricapapayae]RMR00056.1 Glutathione S-transferase protein [Pseudomonas syringae pv. helianthi]